MRKVLLKISGELLSGRNEAVNLASTIKVAQEIEALIQKKIKVAVVIGAGNIMRGGRHKTELDRVTLDYAGMCGTVTNGLVLKAALESLKVKTVLDSTLNISQVGMYHRPERARDDFNEGKVLLMGGTGLPFITTDTAAVVFALELGVDMLLKATKVDGVYDKDPMKYARAKKFDRITYDKVLELGLEVMDQTAFALASENDLPIRVFKWKPGVLASIVAGKSVGSIVTS